MISRLRPIDVTTSFEDRSYKLGEVIDVTIDMTPNRDCLAREGRVDLVLEEQWKETSTLSYEKPIFQTVSTGRSATVQQVGSTTETKQVTKDYKESSVSSRAVFLEDARLRSGKAARHSVRLQIQPQVPPHTGEAKIKWWVQTVIDVAGARDIKPRQRVTVSFVEKEMRR